MRDELNLPLQPQLRSKSAFDSWLTRVVTERDAGKRERLEREYLDLKMRGAEKVLPRRARRELLIVAAWLVAIDLLVRFGAGFEIWVVAAVSLAAVSAWQLGRGYDNEMNREMARLKQEQDAQA